ncbi:MAG: hypothetical protein KDJ52_13705 [Anaerolineae bacterium]|nr:hypothetical protein [Anaerolineae bacterium]
MPPNAPSSHSTPRSAGSKFYAREWGIVALFLGLTILMLYPLSLNLTTMVPEPTDPLLNAWRMQWNAHALLSGPTAAAHIFDTNIFYPYPLTLAYSESFLLIAAQALPFLLITDSHLVGMNLSVLITFVLSGYAMYLLVTAWTANRWAGLVAGILFAFSPHRFGQLNHLELLITQWLPLTLLALHWTLTRPGRRYAVLFALFFNMQALSGFHFMLNLTIACVLLALVYTVTGRVYWRPGLWIAAAVSIVVTLALNWPIWHMYLRFSDVMAAVRTPGEVRIYSAALTDYLTAIPYNFLYGWTFGHWPADNHQIQPLMPTGITGILLVLIALISLVTNQNRNPQPPISNPSASLRTSLQSPVSQSPSLLISNLQSPITLFLLLLTLIALILSFGLNENALGPTFAPLLEYSPYRWLYNHISIFQGIRVPGRYGVLVLLTLSILAGLGTAQLLAFLTRRSNPQSPISQSPNPLISQSPILQFSILHSSFFILLIALILLESWSAPLIGPQFPAGNAIPPVYAYLREQTPDDAVILELPFANASEFLYEYYSSHHWRSLANGGTGFTPPVYKDLRAWFNAFPDPRSLDVIQQLGVDTVILHSDSYEPEAWQRVLSELPRYLSAIESIRQFDDTLVIDIAATQCQADSNSISVSVEWAELDGIPNAAAVTYHNAGNAAFVADVRQVSHLEFADGSAKNFTEPLVTPAGESQTVIVPLPDDQPVEQITQLWLATLNRTETPQSSILSTDTAVGGPDQPLGLRFADGSQLVSYRLEPQSPSACGDLQMALNWQNGQPGDRAVVQLLDPFGRAVAVSEAYPWANETGVDSRRLPLVGALPAGQYGLRVSVFGPDGSERPPVTEEGVTIPSEMIPPLPVTIHPAARSGDVEPLAATFENGVTLIGRSLPQTSLSPGDWLRFALIWQTSQPSEPGVTVFTQLIGPDGQVWGQRDNVPGGGWYPVSLWLPEQPVVDDYAFQIQPEAPPGEYRLIAGLYFSDSQARLLTQTGVDFVEVGTVVVE